MLAVISMTPPIRMAVAERIAELRFDVWMASSVRRAKPSTMMCWLNWRCASSASVRPAQTRRMPSRQRPANPNSANMSIGNKPIRKIGSSGNTSNASDCLRIEDPSTQSIAALKSSSRTPAIKTKKRDRRSAWCHLGTNFGAQLVDQLEALAGLDVPERPAVAGPGALRHRADAVDRADLVAEHDGAVGAHQGAVTLSGVDEFRAWRNHAALDQFGERDAGGVTRGHERRESCCRQRFHRGDARFRRSRIALVAFKADVTPAETFCHGAGGAGAVEGIDHEIAGF